VWEKGFSTADIEPTSIAVDGQGNAYIAGLFQGTIKIGSDQFTSGSYMGGPPGSAISFFLASFTKSGTYRWGQFLDAIDATQSSRASVAVDASGNVFYASSLSTASIKIGAMTYNNPCGVDSDAVLMASFDTLGTPRWVGVYGTSEAYPQALAVNAQGDVVVAGHFAGGFSFGSLPKFPDTNTLFVATFSGGMGTPQVASSFGPPAGVSGQAFLGGLSTDSANNILVAGYYDGSLQVGNQSFGSSGSSDIFVAKFDSFINPKWATHHGSPQADYANAIAVDPGGAFALSGVIGATADLGGGNVSVTAPSGFFAKYDGSGAYVWGQVYGGAPKTGFSSAAADSIGNFVFAGDTVGPVNFGAGPMPATSPNVYLAKLSGTGTAAWAKVFGDTNGQDYAYAATDPTTNEVVFAFENRGTVDLGGGPLMATPTMSELVVGRFQP
jgi:hypothetical protein